jgi:hypothetical protein
MLNFVIPFYESPFDLMNIFNPAFIYFYVTVGAIFSLAKSEL